VCYGHAGAEPPTQPLTPPTICWDATARVSERFLSLPAYRIQCGVSYRETLVPVDRLMFGTDFPKYPRITAEGGYQTTWRTFDNWGELNSPPSKILAT
jgi:hypothetical protein